MTTISNPFQACVQLFVKPRAVFDAIDRHHNWSWIPFIAVMLFSLTPIYVYFTNIDFSWYQDYVLANSGAEISPAERDTLRGFINKNNLLTFTLTISVITQVVVNALLAAYLYLACKSDENNANGFTDWYGFTWWVSLPAVIGFVAAMLVLFIGDSQQMPMGHLQPLSLSYWLNISDSSPWFAFTNAIRPEALLSLYLLAVGISRWTDFPSNKVYLIAFTPFILLMGLWLAILLV